MYRTVEVRGRISPQAFFLLFFLFSALSAFPALGQRAALQWERIGSPVRMDVWGSLVKIDRRGGVDLFESGLAPINDPNQLSAMAASQLILRYRQDGSTDWASLYTPIASPQSVVTVDAAVLDRQDNAFIAGSLYSPLADGAPNFDILVRKVDRHGKPLWVDRYDAAGPNVSLDTAASIALDGYGGVFVSGNSQVVVDGEVRQALTLLHYDGTGNLLWVAHHSDPKAYEEAVTALPDGAGGAYLVGRVFPDSGSGTLVARYGPQGNTLWETNSEPAPSNSGQSFPRAVAAAVDSTGSLYVCVDSLDSLDGFTCLKYSSGGDVLWRREQRVAGSTQSAVQMLIDSRGTVVLGSTIHGSRSGYAVTRISPDGTQKANSIYRGRLNETLYASDLGVDPLGNAFITGLSLSQIGENSKQTTVKFDSTGPVGWRFDYGGPRRTMLDLPKLSVDANSYVAITGMTGSFTVDSWGQPVQSTEPAVYLLR